MLPDIFQCPNTLAVRIQWGERRNRHHRQLYGTFQWSADVSDWVDNKIIPKFHHRIRVWRETKAGIRWRRLLSCPEISPSGESFENLCGGSLWECRSWPPAWMAALSEDAARVKIVYWWWEKARPSRYFYVDGSEEEVTFSYFYSDYGWQIGCFSSSGWGITYWVCCSFIESGAPCLNAGNLNPQF